MITYHLIAFAAGFIIDLILGDPHWLYHPVCAIGNLINRLQKRFLDPLLCEDLKADVSKISKKKRHMGIWTVIIVCGVTVIITSVILLAAYWIHPIAGCVVEAIMTYQILATKCLSVESMKVYEKLTTGTLEEARYAVSMIVGRDTNCLTHEQVAKAAVETVAENTSDGIIAPMLYLAIGGPVLGFFYKAVNTMDSMIGYKNDKYLDYGRMAAKFDDVVNYIPARISAGLMICSCLFLGVEYNMSEAYRIFKRDRYQHASPNSAQTESVCAGALGLKLAGDTSYFGKMVKKPFIGDEKRKTEANDIRRANRLMYATAILCELVCVAGMIVVLAVMR